MSVGLTNTAIKLLGVYPFEVSERLILVLLAWRADENGETRMTKAELERQSGLSRPTVRKTISRLEMMGLASGRRLTLGVRALVRLLAQSEEGTGQEAEGKTVCQKTENGLPSSKPEDGKQFAISAKNGKTENGLPSGEAENGKQFAISPKTKTENGLPSERQTLFQKTENGLPPYRQDYKTRSTACAREGVPEDCSGASGAPTGDGEAEVRAVSPATGRSEPVTVRDKASLGVFMREYPKRSMNRLLVVSAWAAAEAEGISGARILGAMREAALTKGWQEEGGRFVPRAENWLRDRGFEQFLREADRRSAVPTQAEREAAEAARARERMAVDEEVLAMMEDEDGDHV